VAELQVDLVSVDRRVWQGEASMVIARTTEGEIGILPGHAPVLGVLVDGSTVEIRQSAGESLMVAIDGGFLSVDESGVRILAERAELGSEVDVAGARADLDRSGDPDDEEGVVAARRAAARLRAAGQSAQ
jgi:F-type H+-transporting ATPase subunit epsilon